MSSVIYLHGNGSRCNKCRDFHFMAGANNVDGTSFTCYTCRGGKPAHSPVIKTNFDVGLFYPGTKPNDNTIQADRSIIRGWWAKYMPSIAAPRKHDGVMAFMRTINDNGLVTMGTEAIIKGHLEEWMHEVGTYSEFMRGGGWQ